MGGNDDSCIVHIPTGSPELRPRPWKHTLLLKGGWAGNCGGIPNPGSDGLGANSDPLAASNKVAREEGERNHSAQSRPEQLGETQSGERKETGKRSPEVLEPESRMPRDILHSWSWNALMIF